MITTPVLKCPQCGTDDYLYTQPSKHFTYIECLKSEGGCGFQYTLPNDAGTKIKDNLLQQQLEEPLDNFFAGYFGIQEEGNPKIVWVLTGLVSALKKDELEKHLQEKVELFKKIPNVKEVKYELKEYKVV